MTIKQLIEELQKCDPEREVIMSRDAEGNSYSPLAAMWQGAYRATTTWYGEVGLEQLTQDDRDAGYNDEDVMTDGVPAVILCPVN